MRWVLIEKRKAALAKLLRRSTDGIAFNEHYNDDGAIIYRHACALGRERIVSKCLAITVPRWSRGLLDKDLEPNGAGR
jgi:hypothetical protein